METCTTTRVRPIITRLMCTTIRSHQSQLPPLSLDLRLSQVVEALGLRQVARDLVEALGLRQVVARNLPPSLTRTGPSEELQGPLPRS